MSYFRDWMYRRKNEYGFISDEFVAGIDSFISYARSQPHAMDGVKIKCPCDKKKCRNTRFMKAERVKVHLMEHGFVADYLVWNCHGENYFPTYNSQPDADYANYMPDYNRGEDYDPYRSMVMDAAGPSFAQQYYQGAGEQSGIGEQLFGWVGGGGAEFDPRNIAGSSSNPTYDASAYERSYDESPNVETQKWYDMLKASEQELCKGSEHTQLSAMARMLHIKSEHRLSERCYDDFCGFFKEALPPDNNMTGSFYETKKLLKGLGLPVEKIHCCPNGCMLYWRDDIGLEKCKICTHERYKESRGRKRIPFSEMFYLPLTPRLQRLYSSRHTASDMRWHAEHPQEKGVMRHPSDSPAWKQFSSSHPEFASEIRNVRLGLCTDGFAPFGAFAKQFSSWPVILTPYNLPPGLCMKEQFMFLTVLIPGPTNPKQKLDVYLQPLIAELKELWEFGVDTYDISMRQNFKMRAALMWTISDFPAYSMLSGWTTAGKLACPNCMETSDAFHLPNGHKTSWFDNSRKHLPRGHHFRRNKDWFRKDKTVSKVAPQLIKDGHQTLEDIQMRGLRKITEPGAEGWNESISRDPTCGWKKKSIFWDLPYWSSNLIRHNLDVMHIEKNVFENIFNTVMSVEKRTKDNKNSREDLKNFCRRPELNDVDQATGKLRLACYQLEKEQKEALCAWVKDLRFPDGYVSNLGRNVDLGKGKIFGMKSHDCHVFMQRLLPVALRELRPEHVWAALTELSLFFKELTATTLRDEDMARLQKEIPVILCKLEHIFPPSFFDSMEHLPIHLPYEARLAGPVQYRWMYPFERYLAHLKKMVKNKARVEGSIANSYLTEEASNFCSHYFEEHVYTRRRKVDRNDDGGVQHDIPGNIEVFKATGRPWGKCVYRYLDDDETRAAQTYILVNCEEVKDYLEICKDDIRALNSEMEETVLENALAKAVDDYFAYWFREYVREPDNGVVNQFVKDLADYPLAKVETYPVYFVNGYKFHTRMHSSNKSTHNYGVYVYGGTYDDSSTDYYGILDEIIILEYPKNPVKKVALFKCEWFDPDKGTRVHKKYHLVDVHRTKRLNKYEPFVHASQAVQVCYIPYPISRLRYHNKYNPKEWMVVFKVKVRSFAEMPLTNTEVTDDSPAFQENETIANPIVIENDDIIPPSLGNPSGLFIDIYDGDTSSEDEIVVTSSDDEPEFYYEPDE